MDKEQQDLELIEDYLRGGLQGIHIQQFEERLETDSAFNAMFRETKDLINGIEQTAQNEILNRLKTLEEELPPYKQTTASIPIYRKPWALGMAAVITLLLISTFFLFKQQAESPFQSVYAAHFEVYPNVISPTVRSAETSEKTDKQKAYYYYDRGEFEKALDLFKTVPQDDDGGAVLLYTGVSHMMLDNYEKAINVLESYRSSTIHTFLSQVNWYLGLCYLKNNQPHEAASIWSEIPSSNSYYKKVEAIKSTLDSIE